MITLFIFYLHTVAAATLFTATWQEEGLKGGLAAVGFLALIFTVGWPMATIILTLFVPPGGRGAVARSRHPLPDPAHGGRGDRVLPLPRQEIRLI